MIPVIAITGADGYVGSIIANACREKFKIIRLIRKTKYKEDVSWTFDCDVDELKSKCDMLKNYGVTHLIHVAWDMKNLSDRKIDTISVVGSSNLVRAAKEASIENLIFISSISAFEGARSIYGRQKVLVEGIFRQFGGISLRLGLVYSKSPQGVFSTILNMSRFSYVVPLIGTGVNPQYMLHEKTLSQAIIAIIENKTENYPTVVTIAQAKPIALREIVSKLANAFGRQLFFIPLPWWLLYYLVYVAEKLGINLQVKSDSILSYTYQNANPDLSFMKTLNLDTIEFDALEFKRELLSYQNDTKETTVE